MLGLAADWAAGEDCGNAGGFGSIEGIDGGSPALGSIFVAVRFGAPALALLGSVEDCVEALSSEVWRATALLPGAAA